ncbi:ABC transporter permease subunit [Thermophilibacter sp.]
MASRIRSVSLDRWVAFALFVILAVVPFVGSLYNTQTFGRFISYMILALALDILWGGSGLMDLGFAVFFGLGGYVVGISLSIQHGLPAFMTSGGLTELPVFYTPLLSIPVAWVIAIVLPALVALLMGYFVFTSKVKGVFFNIITLAFASLFELLIRNQQAYTGGSTGVNGIARGLSDMGLNTIQWYYVALVALVAVYALCRWLMSSRFGKIVNSVRDNEDRLQFLGYNPATFKMTIFAISGAIAGFAGALYIPMSSFISIDSGGVVFSTTILIWLAVGGRGNLTGAMVGALLVNLLQNTLSTSFGDMWQLVLGVLLILIVQFLPRGIIGTLLDHQRTRRLERMRGETDGGSGTDRVDAEGGR